MPDVFRYPMRMVCGGIDLTHPIDRMPEGSFPYLFNVHILEEGRIEGRPGYTRLISLLDHPNSIRRLNDPDHIYAPDGYIYVGGGGTNLYAGITSAYNIIDSGYSGDPLSLIPFRPDQSPQEWMYVYDKNKNSKVRADGTLRAIGVAPPKSAPDIQYGVPATVDVNTAQTLSTWAAGGAATGPVLTDRTDGSVSIADIIYPYGVIGSPSWAFIVPTAPSLTTTWMRDRMKVTINPGGINEEEVVVREVHQPIATTTVIAIAYDNGNTGPCTMVLNNYPVGLARNSLLELNGTERQPVMEVNYSADGSTYSIRIATAGTIAVGNSVVGLMSWFCYLEQTHSIGDTIRSNYLALTQSGAGTGSANITNPVNVSAANGRTIDPANDYVHVSLFLADPHVVTSFSFLLSLDGPPNFSFTNPGNSYVFTLSGADLIAAGASANAWVEVLLPISEATRTGSDFTLNLSLVQGVALQLVTTGACNWGFDWIYLFGTYGPVILPNSPVGMQYQYRYRDSSTGAHSVPGPLTRYALFPLRESVIITPTFTSQSGVDSDDYYRLGGTITSPLYVASTENLPDIFLVDNLPDLSVLEANQPPDLTALQPWPILINPLVGECTVIGTTVIWTSGDKFPLNLVSNSVILLNGKAYQIQGNPISDTRLELTSDAGFLASSNFLIASPTVTGQSLPYAFGPLEGPFAPVVFALGNLINGGTLYFSNFSDADAASDTNTLDFDTPGHDLVSGDVWNGMAFAGSRESVFCIRFTYFTATGSTAQPFQWVRINSPSGMWSRWACCSTPIGIMYLGRDGIYLATDSGGVNITDERLYPLFPHDGQQASQITIGDNVILPVDMSQTSFLVMTYCDEAMRFCYRDTGGNFNTLIYQIPQKRWLLNNYHNDIIRHYLVESDLEGPNTQQILQLAYEADAVMLSGGNDDDGNVINSLMLTPAMDGGDDRAQKLFVDSMFDVDGVGSFVVEALGTDGQYPIVTSLPFLSDAFRRQYLMALVTGEQSAPCGGGGAVTWILTSTPPDGVRTTFDFNQRPVYVSWNGMNQFQDVGYRLSEAAGVFTIAFIDQLGSTLTPGPLDDIRAEVS